MSDLFVLQSGLESSDAIIFKALGISEVAKIARTETMLRVYLFQQWKSHGASAIKAAVRTCVSGGNEDAILGTLRAAMSGFASIATERIGHDVEDIYRLARAAAFKKGTGKAKGSLQYDLPPMDEPIQKAAGIDFAFDLVDRSAIKALRRAQTYWIGTFFDRALSPLMRRVIAEVLVTSGDRKEAGRALEQALVDRFGALALPNGWKGAAREYWESAAANIAATARAQGQVKSLHDLGFTKYEIVNPMDERTCPICQHMDGKEFYVSQGMDQMNAERTAKDPAAIKTLHPWTSVASLFAVSPTPGLRGGDSEAEALAHAGLSLPPYHFRCRCTIDITSDSI